MKVYTAGYSLLDCEGSTIIGVFSTLDLAIEAIEKYPEAYYDFCGFVEEVELDKAAEDIFRVVDIFDAVRVDDDDDLDIYEMGFKFVKSP